MLEEADAKLIHNAGEAACAENVIIKDQTRTLQLLQLTVQIMLT